MIKNLNKILEKHLKWLRNEDGGERADLRGADLREADLYEADLRGADLYGADLREANLYEANLSRADLSRADLSEANLYEAYLYGADLSRADLSRANLSRADLSRADLYGADLYEADLYEADLRETKIDPMLLNKFYPICCPEAGNFVAWKKVRGNFIVKLEVTENAKRSSAFGRKCRCNEAKVLDIQNLDGTSADVTEVYSEHDANFAYRVGETVRVDNFDEDRRNKCAPGIHFFITRQEAVDY